MCAQNQTVSFDGHYINSVLFSPYFGWPFPVLLNRVESHLRMCLVQGHYRPLHRRCADSSFRAIAPVFRDSMTEDDIRHNDVDIFEKGDFNYVEPAGSP
jgi:hypothetical protein